MQCVYDIEDFPPTHMSTGPLSLRMMTSPVSIMRLLMRDRLFLNLETVVTKHRHSRL